MRGNRRVDRKKTFQLPEVETDSEIIRDWLHQVMKKTGLKATPLAKTAGVAPSTILRALDPKGVSNLERTTLTKIVNTFGVPGPPMLAPGGRSFPSKLIVSPGYGFPDEEMVRLAGGEIPPDMTPTDPMESVWELRTVRVQLAGYLRGDFVLVDQRVTPVTGDLVAAQLFDLDHDGARVVPRIFDPPYIVTEAPAPAWRAKPALVDDALVKIMGTVTKTLRTRRARPSAS